MIKEYITSTIDNIRDKIKNPFTEKNSTPFAGAFIIALIIYNWKLVFSLFTFDSFQTRPEKIEIISSYLQNPHWPSRLGWPLLIAFGSILFYYVFNYLSLGITTFFNRWFKATILYYFDSGKIMTKEEHEISMNKMNVLRLKYEDLKKTFSESQNEIDDKKDQIRNNENEILELKSEITRSTESLAKKDLDIEDLNNLYDEFKVLFARYGFENKFINVTDMVNDKLRQDSMFNVNNEVFGQDPAENVVKELFVIYQFRREVKTFIANEHEDVKLKDNQLSSIITGESKISSMNKNRKLSDIFSGKWQLIYTSGTLATEENLRIDELNKYFVDNVHSFNIRNITVNNKRISFSKIKLDGTFYSEETLLIIDNKHIQGSDTVGYFLKYKKLE